MPPAMSRRLSLAAAVATLACVGCERSRYQVPPILDTSVISPWPERRTLSDPFSSQREYATSISVINPYLYNPANGPQAPDANPKFGSRPSLYTVAASTGSSIDERKEARNQLQSAIVRLSDEAFAQHVARLKASEVATNSTLGILATGLAGGASLATGTAASALSVAAAVTSGSRGIINEQEYRNALVESIILLLQADRRKALQEMHQNQTLSIQQYDVERAIADATDYHFRGSFFNGLALLVEAARKSGNELEQSTLTLTRARSELAKLVAIGGNTKALAGLFKVDESKGVGAWIASASADQVGAALAYLRTRQQEQQEENTALVTLRRDLKQADDDLAELDRQLAQATREVAGLETDVRVQESRIAGLPRERAAAEARLQEAKDQSQGAALEAQTLVTKEDADPAAVSNAQARAVAARSILQEAEQKLAEVLPEAVAQSLVSQSRQFLEAARNKLKELADRRPALVKRRDAADARYTAEVLRVGDPSKVSAPAQTPTPPPGGGTGG